MAVKKVEDKKKWYEILYSVVSFIALLLTVIGGVNALVIDNKPPERLMFMYSNLTTDFLNKKMHVSCFVTINNAGKSSFEVIDSVYTKLWLIPIDTITKYPHFNWQKYMDKRACDSAADISYAGEYAPGDTVRNSFDFFSDSVNANKKKYTVLIKSVAHFKTGRFLWFPKNDSDYCYYAKIRFKTTDSALIIRPTEKKSQK